MARKYMSKKDTPAMSQAGQQTISQAVSQNPSVPMDTMRSMLMDKAMADRSHRIDLPEAMRAKMEAAFGINIGGVNIYESERVADAGVNAIARGGSIAFAPGKDDFNSLDGQRRLGHELSHVAAQARGEVTGSGFLDNGALEARADREGAMAAAGEQVYSGPVIDAPSFSAAAPMQANKDKKKAPSKKEKPPKKPDMPAKFTEKVPTFRQAEGSQKVYDKLSHDYDVKKEAHKQEMVDYGQQMKTYKQEDTAYQARLAQEKEKQEEERQQKLEKQAENRDVQEKIDRVNDDLKGVTRNPSDVSFQFQWEQGKKSKQEGELWSKIEKSKQEEYTLRNGTQPTVYGLNKELSKADQVKVDRLHKGLPGRPEEQEPHEEIPREIQEEDQALPGYVSTGEASGDLEAMEQRRLLKEAEERNKLLAAKAREKAAKKQQAYLKKIQEDYEKQKKKKTQTTMSSKVEEKEKKPQKKVKKMDDFALSQLAQPKHQRKSLWD